MLAGLKLAPVVLINGPRQSGKTTLVRELISDSYPSDYVLLDNLPTRSAALDDPVGFIKSKKPLIIDEIQRVPDLLLAIKESVDNDRRPGRFILTGSARVLLLPRISETLAGRIDILTLWPLSQGEIYDKRETFIDQIYNPEPIQWRGEGIESDQLVERMLQGGFPEAISRQSEDDRKRWYRNYLDTITQREVREIADVERLAQIPRIVSSLAYRTRSPINISDLSSDLGIPRTTLDRYLTLLEHVFTVRSLPGWHRNPLKQLVKSPKVLICDSGLHAYLMQFDAKRILADNAAAGLICENFIGMELVKQLSWSHQNTGIYHLRSSKGVEIDFILETIDRRVVALEVKVSSTVRSEDFRHLAWLRDRLGKRFTRGVVLYAGDKALPFGDRLEAVPMSAVWS